jgi:hypothetical protein
MAVLIAAAMPIRLPSSFLIVNSVSILDLLFIVALVTLVLDVAVRPLNVGYPAVFGLLCLPFLLSVLSLAWSHDHSATLRAILTYGEGIIAYLFAIRELEGLSAARVITYMKRYVYLLIIPAILLLFHVPGFAPYVDFKESSGGYLTYFTRLSHPVLGGSNNLATVLAFFAPILLYWGHAHHDRRVSRAGFVALIAIFLTLSRGILIAFAIAGLLYALVAYRPTRSPRASLGGKIMAVVALGVVAVAVFYTLNPATREFFSGRFASANVDTRGELISLSFTEIASNPVLGIGSGVNPQITEINLEIYENELHGVNTYIPPQELDSHNAYVQQALYFGLPLGFIVSLSLWGLAAFFLNLSRVVALAGVVAYTLVVQLVSFLFESSFEGTVLRVLFFLSIGLATALLRSTEDEASTPQGANS